MPNRPVPHFTQDIRALPGFPSDREEREENMYRRLAVIAVGLVLAGLLAVPQAKADTDNVVIITTNAPLEIPGRVLPAGTYKLRFMDPAVYNDLVSVTGSDGTFYGYHSVIPDHRTHATDGVGVVVQTQAEAPARLEAWFTPASHEGLEFVYPHSREQQLARHNLKPAENLAD